MPAFARRRWAPVGFAAGALAILALLAVVLWALQWWQLRPYVHRIDALERSNGLLLKALGDEQQNARDSGVQPVTPPADELAVPAAGGAASGVGAKGDKGDKGPGPTDDQVRRALAAYFAANPIGPGKPPTEASIAAAQAAYCASRNDCRGPVGVAGKDGAAGTNGKDGAAGAAGATVVGPQGEQGPPPSDDQINDSVAAFCAAHGNCVGATGPAGGVGPQGPPVGGWSFMFGLTNYDCGDPNGDNHYECTATPLGPAEVTTTTTTTTP